MNATNRKHSLRYLDWKVVKMAREDGPKSLNPYGLAARLASALFGFRIPQPLANERLEALRRFAVRAWYWDLIRMQDLQAFLRAGFTEADADRVLDHVAAHRGFIPTIQEAYA